MSRPTVVIVGAGFGGLRAARTLRRAPVEVILIDRHNRSEEHTSELQSQSNLVCRLLLEKKKKDHTIRSEEHTSELQSQSNIVFRLLLEKKEKTTKLMTEEGLPRPTTNSCLSV